MFNTGAKETETREKLWLAYNVVGKVEQNLLEMIDTGKLANKQLEDFRKNIKNQKILITRLDKPTLHNRSLTKKENICQTIKPIHYRKLETDVQKAQRAISGLLNPLNPKEEETIGQQEPPKEDDKQNSPEPAQEESVEDQPQEQEISEEAESQEEVSEQEVSQDEEQIDTQEKQDSHCIKLKSMDKNLKLPLMS